MATGGPETNAAIGQPDVPNIESAIAKAATPPVPDAAPAADPLAPDVQRPARNTREEGAGAGRAPRMSMQGADLGDRYYPRQQDFYATPDPWTAQTTSGAYPIPSAGQVPFAVLAARQQELNKKKEALEKTVKSFDPQAGLNGVKPQYQLAFNQWSDQELMGLYQSAVKAHGGDERSAILELQDPSTEFGRAWARKKRDVNAVGSNLNYLVDDAIALAGEIEKDQASDPGGVMRQTIQKLLAGTQQLGRDGKFDAAAMREIQEEFTRQRPLLQLIKDYKVAEQIESMYAQNPYVDFRRDDKGFNVLITDLDHVQDAREGLRMFARNLKDSGQLPDRTLEDIEEDLFKRFPIKVEKKVSTTGKSWAPDYGSGSGSGPLKNLTWGTAKYNDRSSGVAGSPLPHAGKIYDEVTEVTAAVNGRPLAEARIKEVDKNGAEVPVRVFAPTFKKDASGQWMVSGVSATDSEVALETARLEAEGYAGEELLAEVSKVMSSSKTARPVTSPVSQNLSTLRAQFGQDFGPETLDRISGGAPKASGSKPLTYNPVTDEFE